jgi:glycosyltransferase involved in cell wall biosynthesis
VTGPPRVYAVSTFGSGSNDETRILALLSAFEPRVIPFDRRAKWQGFKRILRTVRRERPSLVVLEGSGLAGGAALLLSRLLAGVPYVVSSGDAIGPWVARHAAWAGPAFHLYERVLCRFAAGFIGWTPYLVGRAMTFGTRRAMTAAGYAPFPLPPGERERRRAAVRAELSIAPDDLVFGLAGSLVWNRRVRYCYGQELVQALLATRRPDVRVLVVGDGSGQATLARLACDRLGRQVLLPGRVPQDRVMDYLAAMDVASLPQSCDPVGSFRYTTKISEYLAAGLPVVTGQIPMAYDLDCGFLWRLPGASPWDPKYVTAMARLMDGLTTSELVQRRAAVPANLPEFDLGRQVARTTAFISDILTDLAH